MTLKDPPNSAPGTPKGRAKVADRGYFEDFFGDKYRMTHIRCIFHDEHKPVGKTISGFWTFRSAGKGAQERKK